MLRTRVLTAIALLAVVLPVAWSGSLWAVGAVALLATVAGGWEWTRLFGLSPLGVPAALLATAVALVISFAAGSMPAWAEASGQGLLIVAAVFWVAQALPAVLAARLPDWLAGKTVASLVGVLLLLAFLLAVLGLYQRGPVTLLSALVIVWVSDISAYFCGRRFGRHKLAPAVSPGKTWEGAIGAAVVVTLLALIWAAIASGSDLVSALARRGPVLVPAIVALVALGIVGDLFESLLKRRAGLKDSSGLLPGHGGVLDRIDALLPVLPVAELLLRWLA
ncbi:phosphatidate cytidylyltransferase [Derxia lacustris]|uniref:phosphatidate cytidylyltransferase n=1 Tax=Derxia lacustris TaxID=764842 RepID=UPI000A175CF1|nr:phosphatidate cytidylyltransferase [Derxia lacustris]